MEKHFVYADNAATTRVSETALAAAMPYYRECYGNASSIYSLGMNAAHEGTSSVCFRWVENLLTLRNWRARTLRSFG